MVAHSFNPSTCKAEEGSGGTPRYPPPPARHRVVRDVRMRERNSSMAGPLPNLRVANTLFSECTWKSNNIS